MKMKRFLSLFICLAMLLSMIPATAFAGYDLTNKVVLSAGTAETMQVAINCFNYDETTDTTTYYNFAGGKSLEVTGESSGDEWIDYLNDGVLVSNGESIKLMITLGANTGYLCAQVNDGVYSFAVDRDETKALSLTYDMDNLALFISDSLRLCYDGSFKAADISETSDYSGPLTMFEFYGKKEKTPTSVTVNPSNKKYTGKAYALSDSDYTVTGADKSAAVISYYSDEACTKAVTPVNVGTYYVKVSIAETDDYLASSATGEFKIERASASVTVTADPAIVGPNASTVITAKVSHNECSSLTATVSWTEVYLIFFTREHTETVTLNRKTNGTYSGTFIQNLSSQNVKNDTLTVTVDVPETANYNAVSGSATVTVDASAPTATITVGSKKSSSFVNSPSFNTFFKSSQTAAIDAKDAVSGVDKVYYYISSKAMTLNEVKNIKLWKEGTSFTLSPQTECIVYVKAVDTVGNETYISTDGLVFDSIAPTVTGISNGRTYYDGVQFTVNDKYISKVTVNGTEVTPIAGNTYAITADAVKEKTIVATDKAGNSITVKITLLCNATGITITTDVSESIVVGNTITLAASVSPEYAYDPSYTWSSSNTSIATIDSKGVVTAVAQGTVIITAKTSNGITTTKTIKVIPQTVRLNGSDRIRTAINICQSGWTSADNVIITNSNSFADALAAGPLAHKLDAPILLTSNSGTYIDAPVTVQLTKLNAKNIYLIGGKKVINSESEDLLKALGYNVIRISGSSRYDTAVAIAKKLDSLRGKAPSNVFVVNGMNYPDALSVSTVAALSGSPILFTEPASSSSSLNSSTSAYLKSVSFTSGTVIGGQKTISDTVLVNLKSCGARSTSRIAGSNRYATSSAIISTYSSLFKSSDFAFATGTSFPDALAGSVYAAKKSMPVFLVASGEATTAIKTQIQSRPAKNLYVFGGEKAVSTAVIDSYLK